MTINIGDKVRVSPHHWLRPNEAGTIVAFNGDRGDAHWEVEFPPQVGRGFEGGKYLWLSDTQLTVEKQHKAD